MKKHYESLKKLYRSFSMLFLVFFASGFFIEVWARKYNAMIVFPYYFKGFCMITAMYGVLIYFLTWLFNGSQIGYLRRKNAVFSQALAVLTNNILFYLVTTLLATFFVPLWGFLFLTAGQLVVLSILNSLLNYIFDRVFPSISMLLIYGDQKENEIRRMTRGWTGKYQIKSVISIKKGRHKCIAAIKQHDAVVLCDIPEGDRNVIAQYCQDEHIPTYFTPGMSEIMFSNAEGLRFFEGRTLAGGLGFIFGNTLSAAQRFSLIEYLKKVYKGSRSGLYDEIAAEVDEEKKRFIVTANPETLMTGLETDELDTILLDDDTMIVPDGIGLVKALQIAGYGSYNRIPGVEFASMLLKMAEVKTLGVFLYGSSQEVIEKMQQLMKREYPHARLLGAVNGYDYDQDEVMREAAAKKPDIILVALGVPAQEHLIARHYGEFEKGIFVGVGGSFDVLSGCKKRAPEIFLKLNLEWLYRITKEPKRLGRFFRHNVRFLWEVMRIRRIR